MRTPPAFVLPGVPSLEPSPAPRRARDLSVLKRTALRVLPVALIVAAGWVLWRQFHKISVTDLLGFIEGWGAGRLALALFCCVASFALVGLVEWRALRWTGARVPLGEALTGSFVANAFGHALGANLLVSAAVRARVYARRQVGLMQVTSATLYQGVSFILGLGSLTGLGLVTGAVRSPVAFGAHVAGAAILAAVGAYILACATFRRPLVLFSKRIPLPTVGDALLQLGLGVVDMALAVAIIWLLLPPGASYLQFVIAYTGAYLVGLGSGVPGGAGVFEGALLQLLPDLDMAGLAAAFLGYRAIYYLLPLALGALVLAFGWLGPPAKTPGEGAAADRDPAPADLEPS